MKLFISYQKKIFTSPLIYISIIGIALLSYMGMPKIDLEFGVIHAFDIMIELSVYNKIMMIFVSIPFTATFCNEYNYRVTNSILIRTTENKYLMTHIVMTFILSVITAFLGIMLCIATMSLKYPFFVYDMSFDGWAIESLCINGHEYLYLFIKVLLRSISLAAWSISGLAISAAFVNPFVAVISPLIFSYIIELFTVNTKSGKRVIPYLYRLSQGYTNVSESWIVSCGYIILVFLILAVIFSLVFIFLAKRRLRNEFS